jgi:hypothetical protein
MAQSPVISISARATSFCMVHVRTLLAASSVVEHGAYPAEVPPRHGHRPARRALLLERRAQRDARAAARVAADVGKAAQHERGGLRRREPDELEEHLQPHAALRHERLQGH